MKPRHFYRWKSFWFGLLVFEFLCWSWERSLQHWDEASLGFDGFGIYLQQYRGVVVAGAAGKGWLPAGIHASSTPIEEEVLRFKPALDRLAGEGLLAFKCGHGILLLLFLLMWAGWLHWHWKREQRKVLISAGNEDDPAQRP